MNAESDFVEAQTAVLETYGIGVEERWIEAPVVDGKAHVLISGEGIPVVLLNGIGVPAAMLAPLMAHLHGVRMHAVDLPGFGLTDITPGFAKDLRFNAVRFLTQVLDGLGLDRAIVVANSLASLWSSWLAIDEPEKVTALAHIGCPAIVFETSAPLPMRLLSSPVIGPLITRLQPPTGRQVEQMARMVNEHPLPPEIAELILATERLDHFQDAFLPMLRRLLRLRGNRPELALAADHLAQIQAPTLLVLGTDDPMGAASVGRRIADTMIDAELHLVEGGHAPWIHHADQIAIPLAAFLRRFACQEGS